MNEMKVRSIQYVYDADAAKAWFDIYVELLMGAMIDQASHKLSKENKKEGDSP
jgi:hypothetical protein